MCVLSVHRVGYSHGQYGIVKMHFFHMLGSKRFNLRFFSANFRELTEYLNTSTELLAKNGNILDNVLETLDIQQHSLGVLYVLVAKFTNLSVSAMQIEEPTNRRFHFKFFLSLVSCCLCFNRVRQPKVNTFLV